MQAVQREIAEQLKVQPPFADDQALQAEIATAVRELCAAFPAPGLEHLV